MNTSAYNITDLLHFTELIHDRRHISRGFYSEAPDDKMFHYLATTYANNHRVMQRNIKCEASDNFPGGVTNGAHWYDVPGGLVNLVT